MDSARWRAEREALREEAEQGYTSLSADLTARAREVASALRRDVEAAREAGEDEAARLAQERDGAMEEADRLRQQLDDARERICALEEECGRMRQAVEKAKGGGQVNALRRELALEQEAREEAQHAARLLATEVAELRQRWQAPQTSPLAAGRVPRRAAALHASMRTVAPSSSPARGEAERPVAPAEAEGALSARIDASRALIHALDAASRVSGGTHASPEPQPQPEWAGQRPSKGDPAATRPTPENEFRALFLRTRATKRRQRALHAPGEDEGGPLPRRDADAEGALAGEEELHMRPPIEIAGGPG